MESKPKSIFPEKEEKILEYWEKEKIFEATLAKEAPRGNFVFFEGPPTANGKPGIHHVEARAFKDLIPRYKTMRGYHVERKAGWDTHGLPVELQVEKKLGISGKPQIEALKDTPAESIAYFNKKCKESVWEYLDEWVRLTKRMAFWIDLKNPYITYETSYIESLWWIIKEVWKKGLLVRDFKVVPYCPRCGTALSSHEVAQGYKETTDPSIFIRFKIKGSSTLSSPRGSDEKFLVWTTTPWTLPANVALAVGEDFDYAKVKMGNEILILAKTRLETLGKDYDILKIMKGRELLGMAYEPLYPFLRQGTGAYKVIAGDFVSTSDGTGIVHIAPAFGEDDLRVAKANNLPMIMTADSEGKFNFKIDDSFAQSLNGYFVKDADKKIIENLESRGILYKSGEIKHEYPFCWRCSTPLLYYARLSWFIKMSKLRETLIKENAGINWVPDHIKEGRFGEWLNGVKDWAFSRERYWGTPLPIWECECKETKVLGSLEDFPESKSGNTYYFLRHGEADSNVKNIASSDIKAGNGLTETGKKQIRSAAKKLAKEKINLIFSSPYPRTKETAEIVAKAIDAKIIYDKRLREMEFGEYDGLPVPEFRAKFPDGEMQRFKNAPKNGETLQKVAKRMVEFALEMEEKYKDKKILIVSHGDPLWVLEGALKGKTAQGIANDFYAGNYISNGEIRKIKLKDLPRNEDGFVDLHRPYIDSIGLPCDKCGRVMKRVPEVCDVWFDSGAMPMAQWHYPFENEQKIKKKEGFPADFIAEAIDQTRGWFYTLLSVSTLLGMGKPYKNVVSLGHILDAQGQKMSKSKDNVVNPWEMFDRYGADAVRWYMYTINQPGDNKKFDETVLDEMVRKTFMIIWNVHIFGKTYSSPTSGASIHEQKQKNILDRWIIAKLNLLIKNVTAHLDAYRIPEAGREITDFITDLSTWYIRRSRERFKAGKAEARETLKTTLLSLSKLMAPFTPFISESLYLDITEGKEKKSIHLESWPAYEARLIDERLIEEMAVTRQLASMALEARATAQIPVRQVLRALEVKCKKLDPELLDVLKSEVNVKEVRYIKSNSLDVALDTVLTPELRREGLVREISRHVNDLRKEAKLTPADRIILNYDTDGAVLKDVFTSFAEAMKTDTRSDEITAGKTETKNSKTIELDEESVWIGITKK